MSELKIVITTNGFWWVWEFYDGFVRVAYGNEESFDDSARAAKEYYDGHYGEAL